MGLNLNRVLRDNWTLIPIIILFIIVLSFWNKIKSWFYKSGFVEPNPNDKHEYIAYLQFEAMAESYGTNENKLFSSLNNLTTNDLIKVFNSFGIRRRTRIGGRRLLGIFGKPLNLIQWYDRELNKNELHEMYLIWSKTGLFENFSEKEFT
jgi:hypothetical protein